MSCTRLLFLLSVAAAAGCNTSPSCYEVTEHAFKLQDESMRARNPSYQPSALSREGLKAKSIDSCKLADDEETRSCILKATVIQDAVDCGKSGSLRAAQREERARANPFGEKRKVRETK
jgi:hypothetical protein